MQTLVITPTYNERDNIQPFVEATLETCPQTEMLIIDDNSPDGTGEIADKLATEDGRVRVHHREGKLGLGSAYVSGFKFALENGHKRIVEMDADFSHRPQDLPRLLDASEHADVVIGSRNVEGGAVENWSLLRRAVSRGGSLYARTMLGLSVSDATSGFKCFRREVLEALDLDQVESDGYAFQVEMNYLCEAAGFHVAEVPITFPDRKAGQSKMSRQIVVEAAVCVRKLRKRGKIPSSTPSESTVPSAPAAAPIAPHHRVTSEIARDG